MVQAQACATCPQYSSIELSVVTDCLNDKSLITSIADVERLSNKPTSPGSGLRVPKENLQGGAR